RRALHPQHQLDQLLAAQPLKIASAHPTRESAKPNPRKGVGNYKLTLKYSMAYLTPLITRSKPSLTNEPLRLISA
ncbi:hypothetical protein, partial [Methylobacterium sp. WL12]|uniref:hypothetical protein n=1 Tax=Methylobacterium sp. WL12 TaxID=2603890 RepID=UPI001AEE8B6B